MWSSITELMAKLVTPLVNIVLARLLMPEAFGVVATITLVISFAEVFTDAGFQKYLIQHEFESEDALNKSTNVAFWTNLSVSALACVIVFVFRNPIAELVGNPQLGMPISIASILILFHAFSSIQMARYKRDFDFKTLFYVRIITVLIPIVVTIPLAIVLRNYWALLIGSFASQFFCSVALIWKSKWKIKFYYSFSLFKEMFSFTAWTLLEQVSIWLTSNIDIFIISKFLSDYYLGLYKTSMSTVSSYMGLITSAVIPVLFSALSRCQNEDDKFKSTYYTFQRLTAVLVVPMGIGIFIFSDLVTLILLGENWMEASGFIGWWGITGAFSIIFSHFSSEVIRSKGKPIISFFIQISQLFVLVPVLIWCKNGSFDTIYISRSLVRFELMTAALIVMRVCFGFKFIDVFKNIFPIIASSVFMGVVALLLQQIGDSILWQLISIVICVIAYFSCLMLFPKMRVEAIRGVKKVLHKG